VLLAPLKAYRNNPLKYTDPSGFETGSEDGENDTSGDGGGYNDGSDSDQNAGGQGGGSSGSSGGDGDGNGNSGSGGSVDNDAAIDAAIAAAEASVAQNRENNKAGGFNTNDYSSDWDKQQEVNMTVDRILNNPTIPKEIKNSLLESPPTYNPNPNFKKDKHWYGRYTSDFWKKDTIELSPEIWDNPSRPDQLLSTTIHEALHGTDLVPSHGLDPDSPEWKNYYDYVDQLIDDMKNK